MNYYIADTHFFDSGCLREDYDHRPFSSVDEMNQVLRKNWNETVTNGDMVYILGDVCRIDKHNLEETIGFLATLKGNKVLIQGNHERIKDQRLRQLFVEICDYKKVHEKVDGRDWRLVLSHFPILMWDGQHRSTLHLYGHLHGTYDETFMQRAVADLNQYYKERDEKQYKPFYAVNMGCMLWDYRPVTLREILEAKVLNV